MKINSDKNEFVKEEPFKYKALSPSKLENIPEDKLEKLKSHYLIEKNK